MNNTNKLRVGIFGYYSYSNLGDNMMAHMIYRHVVSKGHPTVLFSRDQSFHKKYGYKVEACPSELARNVDVIIFGGGGLLIPRKNLSGEGMYFNEDLKAVLSIANEREIPLFGVSLGGAGVNFDEITPPTRQTLLKSLNYVTLRNKQDHHLLDQTKTPGECLGDIVWATSKLFSKPKLSSETPPSQDSDRIRIGINMYLTRSRRYRALQKLLELAIAYRKNWEFIFYELHPQTGKEFRALNLSKSRKNCRSCVLTDPEQATEEMKALDLIITTRLHIGVVAMSTGTPSIAYAAQPKTR
ncbi:polysaccharide pyruvyl transferase family protein, partial [Mariniblastus sp.]|nr:polysaccharide pyruvyl transferase family protein [Mariniblastus sp.]